MASIRFRQLTSFTPPSRRPEFPPTQRNASGNKITWSGFFAHHTARFISALSATITRLCSSTHIANNFMHTRNQNTATPNHALQRTPGFGVQLPSAAVARPAQSRAVRHAMKPGTARAFALRRRAHSRAPGPESLSLGSLGVATRTG